jgi:hypothetical protein
MARDCISDIGLWMTLPLAMQKTMVSETAAAAVGGSGMRLKWTHGWLRLLACCAGAAAGGCCCCEGGIDVGVAAVLVQGLRQEVETFFSFAHLQLCRLIA